MSETSQERDCIAPGRLGRSFFLSHWGCFPENMVCSLKVNQMPDMAVRACNPRTRVKSQVDPGSWLATQPSLRWISSSVRYHVLKEIRHGEIQEDIWHPPLASTCICWGARTCTPNPHKKHKTNNCIWQLKSNFLLIIQTHFKMYESASIGCQRNPCLYYTIRLVNICRL